ncbi:MAG: NAD(P)-dependent alcohol dehydrogenase [Saccharospirillum sp.]
MANTRSLPDTMQAWACTGYGGPEKLGLQTFPIPPPKAHQLLVRVLATTVDSADVRIRTQTLPKGMGAVGRLVFGLRRPRRPILGTSVVGEVVSVGTRVRGFQPGDRVAGMTGMTAGGHAQFCCLGDASATLVPAGVSNEHAVAVLFGGVTALHFLRSARLKAGESVLVLGASGAVGSALVQLAVHQNASVTAMTSGKNQDWVSDLGADRVEDYNSTPLLALGTQYDIIADTVAATSFAEAKPILKEQGRYLAIAGGLPDMLVRPSGTKRSITGAAGEAATDMQHLLKLVSQGDITPVIHEVLDWSLLPKAHAIAESGHKRGSLVVRLPH